MLASAQKSPLLSFRNKFQKNAITSQHSYSFSSISNYFFSTNPADFPWNLEKILGFSQSWSWNQGYQPYPILGHNTPFRHFVPQKILYPWGTWFVPHLDFWAFLVTNWSFCESELFFSRSCVIFEGKIIVKSAVNELINEY